MKRTNGFLIGALFVLAVFLLAAPGGSQRLETMAFGSGVYNLPVMLDVNEAGQLVVTELGTGTPIPTDSPTPTYTPKPTATVTATDTPLPPTLTPTATTTQTASIEPYPEALPCTDHDNNTFHTIWNDVDGCHYDHEHGLDPFVAEVETAFPGLDLFELLGGVQIGHTNPSSPAENVAKHGGMKWDVTLSHSTGCVGEVGSPIGVDALVIQYHNFGNYAVEFNARIHSAVGMLRQCLVDNPTDYGYVFVNQHQDYGQRVSPYQGPSILQYPDTPLPAYAPGASPYFTIDCFGIDPDGKCRISRQFVIDRNANASSTWVSRPQAAPIGSPLFSILFRLRDTYQLFDWTFRDSPQTPLPDLPFVWLCSSNGGITYDASMPRCRWNNSTTRIHEVWGEIPAAWDGLAGFDTDQREGRITAEGYVTAFGDLNMGCTEPGTDCHPIVLIGAFVGRYVSTFGLLPGSKGSFAVGDTPERDIYFCNGQPCNETDAGSLPSGWIGGFN